MGTHIPFCSHGMSGHKQINFYYTQWMHELVLHETQVLVRTYLPRDVLDIHLNDIHNPEGYALGIMNIV